jgi:hypothetical protein
MPSPPQSPTALNGCDSLPSRVSATPSLSTPLDREPYRSLYLPEPHLGLRHALTLLDGGCSWAAVDNLAEKVEGESSLCIKTG